MKASVNAIHFHKASVKAASTTSTEKASGCFVESSMTAAPTESWTEAASRQASGEEVEAFTETVVHELVGKLPWKLLARPCAKR